MRGEKLFQQWLLQLRNPDQQQAIGQLYQGPARCALGVCGEIFAKSVNVPHSTITYQHIAGALEPLPVVMNFVMGVDVPHLNDHRGLTLPEIADVLEAAYCKWLDEQEVKSEGARTLQEVAA